MEVGPGDELSLWQVELEISVRSGGGGVLGTAVDRRASWAGDVTWMQSELCTVNGGCSQPRQERAYGETGCAGTEAPPLARGQAGNQNGHVEEAKGQEHLKEGQSQLHREVKEGKDQSSRRRCSPWEATDDRSWTVSSIHMPSPQGDKEMTV